MNREYKSLQPYEGEIQNERGINFNTVVVSDEVHQSLFTKGIVQKTLSSILPIKAEPEGKVLSLKASSLKRSKSAENVVSQNNLSLKDDVSGK